MPATAMTEAKQ